MQHSRVRRFALPPEGSRASVARSPPTRAGAPDAQETAMTPLRPRRRLACLLAALAAGGLIAAAGPPRAWAAADDAKARPDQCPATPPGAGHPPVNLTPVTLQLLQR